ncbi:MAG TPA: MFS transporter [Polyangiaceae bacterium]|nr:MFS transporter [Polyangiaceae bacterium]
MSRLRRPTGGLWSHPDFVKLWAGQSISELGSQVSQLAIPWLAAVGLHASPIEFSLLGVLGFLPFILFALPAGVWVDRLRRRQILIVGDASRAVILALIPILWAFGVLQIWHLLVLTFVIGCFTVFFDVAYQSYLPALIEREHLVDGNSKLQLTVSIAQVGGPSLAGGLIGAITAPYAIVADAVSFVVSSVFMIRMRHRENLPRQDADEPRPKMWPQVREGLAWVLGNRNLRAIAGCTGTSNFCTNLLFAVGLLYFVRVLHLSSIEVGAVFAVGSVGSITGALLANRLQKRLGVGNAIVSTAVLFSLGGLAFPLAPRAFPLPVLMAGMAVFGFGGVAYNIVQVSYRQAITPERLQGRMNAAMRWVVWGTIPLGTLAGGAIAQAFSLKASLWVGAVLGVPTFLWVLLSPLRSIRTMPEPVIEPTPAEAELAGGLVEGTPLPGPAAADA